MTIRVSTCCLQLLDSGLGGAAAAIALEAERLGDDPDGEHAAVARRLGDDRGGAGAGAAAHAGGDEAHMGAVERLLDLVERLFGGGLADLRPRAGAEALGDPQAELDALVGGRGVERLSVRIGDKEVDALNLIGDHVGDGVAAGAAHADDADPGPQLVHFGPDEVDAHACSPPDFAQRDTC